MTIKSVKKFDINEVEEIFLLSIDEWENARKIKAIPIHTGWWWWWLRSPGYGSFSAVCVIKDGSISCFGGYVDYDDFAVRPAFKIPNLKTEIGDKVLVKNTICTVIGKDVALSDTAVCFHRFDEHTNDYEKSEIKEFLHSDEFKSML